MGAGNTAGRSTAVGFALPLEAIEESAPLLDATAQSLRDIAEAIALSIVAPVVLAAERRQRAARTLRASSAKRAA